MLPSNFQRNAFSQIGSGGINTQSRESWQWQPTLTVHDPNPPITLEDAAVAATSLVFSNRTRAFNGLVVR